MSGNHKSAVSQCPSPGARARVRIIHLTFCTDFQDTWDTWDTGTRSIAMSGRLNRTGRNTC